MLIFYKLNCSSQTVQKPSKNPTLMIVNSDKMSFFELQLWSEFWTPQIQNHPKNKLFCVWYLNGKNHVTGVKTSRGLEYQHHLVWFSSHCLNTEHSSAILNFTTFNTGFVQCSGPTVSIFFVKCYQLLILCVKLD